MKPKLPRPDPSAPAAQWIEHLPSKQQVIPQPTLDLYKRGTSVYPSANLREFLRILKGNS